MWYGTCFLVASFCSPCKKKKANRGIDLQCILCCMLRPARKPQPAVTSMIELCPGICCTINTGVKEAPELLDVSDTPDIGKPTPSTAPGRGLRSSRTILSISYWAACTLAEGETKGICKPWAPFGAVKMVCGKHWMETTWWSKSLLHNSREVNTSPSLLPPGGDWTLVPAGQTREMR